jgi:hypothetical protein
MQPVIASISLFNCTLDSCLTRFLHANRYPPTDQVQGHASLENALIFVPAGFEGHVMETIFLVPGIAGSLLGLNDLA